MHRRRSARMATLALLIVIVALATALFVQWRRERVLKAHVQVLEAETARNRRPIDRMIFDRIEYARQREVKEVNKLRAEIDRLSDDRMRSERLTRFAGDVSIVDPAPVLRDCILPTASLLISVQPPVASNHVGRLTAAPRSPAA